MLSCATDTLVTFVKNLFSTLTLLAIADSQRHPRPGLGSAQPECGCWSPYKKHAEVLNVVGYLQLRKEVTAFATSFSVGHPEIFLKQVELWCVDTGGGIWGFGHPGIDPFIGALHFPLHYYISDIPLQGSTHPPLTAVLHCFCSQHSWHVA